MHPSVSTVALKGTENCAGQGAQLCLGIEPTQQDFGVRLHSSSALGWHLTMA